MTGPSEKTPDTHRSHELQLPQVYPITDVRLSGLSHSEQVLRLVEGGATLVQLRDKELSAVEFYRQAEEALRVARARNVKIIINDRVDIALALAADGVHLGLDDLPPEAARRLLGSEVVIGFSTHNLAQALSATRLPVDYLAIGPIFTTRSKANADPAIGLEGLRAIRTAVGATPLVAIGGITAANAGDVLATGADAVAVISELYVGDDVSTRLKQLHNSI